MSTTFEYTPARTMDAYGAPHVQVEHATRIVTGEPGRNGHFSTWGYAVECDACGERIENPGASSVTSEDHPPRFATERRHCMEDHMRRDLEREHIAARIARYAEALKSDARSYYGAKSTAQEVARLGLRSAELSR